MEPTPIVVLILIALLVANIILWRMLLSWFHTSLASLRESGKYENILEANARAESLLKAMNELSLTADRAKSVVSILERKVATATNVADMIERHRDEMVSVLTDRSFNVADYVTEQVLDDVIRAANRQVERSLPELINTKVRRYGIEYTIVNTLDSAEVEIDIELRHVAYDRLRAALVKGFARLPLQGKPQEEKQAQAYIERAFGSEADFEGWWLGLSQVILDQRLQGRVVIMSKPNATVSQIRSLERRRPG